LASAPCLCPTATPATAVSGFECKDFEDAWLRYPACEKKHDLGTNDDPERNTATTQRGQWESPDFEGATADPCGGLKNGSKPLADNDCGGVADRNGEDAHATLSFDAGRDAERFDLDDQDEDEERFQ